MADPRRLVVSLFAMAILTAACGSSPATQEPADLEVFGVWQGVAADELRSVLSEFTAETGITTRYIGTSSVLDNLEERLAEGNPPDVAVVSQPAVVRDLFVNGYVLGLPDDVATVVDTNYRSDVLELMRVAGVDVAVWLRASVKNLVWYVPELFVARGYEIPTTWADLSSLQSRMFEDGITPWCMGLAAFGASGWPGTDWVEQILLGAYPVDVYDAWVVGDVPFTDDRVRAAFDVYKTQALVPGFTRDGARGALGTLRTEAGLPLFDDPPGCAMYRQASFNAAELPADTEIGPEGDVNVFPFPGFEGIDPPLHAGGDFAVALQDRPEVWALMAYFADPASAEVWDASGGLVAPHASFDTARYGESFARYVADLLRESASVRFDGSDLMPPDLATAFNEGILDLIATGDVEGVTQTLQEEAEAAGILEVIPFGS